MSDIYGPNLRTTDEFFLQSTLESPSGLHTPRETPWRNVTKLRMAFEPENTDNAKPRQLRNKNVKSGISWKFSYHQQPMAEKNEELLDVFPFNTKPMKEQENGEKGKSEGAEENWVNFFVRYTISANVRSASGLLNMCAYPDNMMMRCTAILTPSSSLQCLWTHEFCTVLRPRKAYGTLKFITMRLYEQLRESNGSLLLCLEVKWGHIPAELMSAPVKRRRYTPRVKLSTNSTNPFSNHITAQWRIHNWTGARKQPGIPLFSPLFGRQRIIWGLMIYPNGHPADGDIDDPDIIVCLQLQHAALRPAGSVPIHSFHFLQSSQTNSC